MAIGVGFGTIGAQALKDVLNEEQLSLGNKGVFYQLIHAIGLLIVFLLSIVNNKVNYKWCSLFFKIGVLFFSGSLYIIAINKGILGEIQLLKFCLIPITPLGGISLITGWILLAKKAIKN